jgi:hypothetical protein
MLGKLPSFDMNLTNFCFGNFDITLSFTIIGKIQEEKPRRAQSLPQAAEFVSEIQFYACILRVTPPLAAYSVVKFLSL